MSNENKKDWERPWTTEEIVEHADNWNLACDAALLNTLKAFGDKILKKAEDVNQKIDNLNKDLSKIHIQVDLARNEFSSLRNTQFVECRVYEDDETLLSEEPKDEKESDVPEEETLDDFREAVALGLDILDEYYDKVVVNVSDSEGEDEDVPSYVYSRKDPYINRRLPYVIGSEEWHKKWHVGLEETDSENENSSENVSDSESDQFFQNKDHSDASSELSNLSGLNRSKVGPPAVSTTTTTPHDLGASTSRSDVPEEPIPKTLSFAEQLAVKLGNVIKETADSLDEPDVNRRPIQKKPSDYGALFSNEPPPLDDIKPKETHGIFSGGKGLFDDEDEDDLWNPVKTESSSTRQLSTSDQKRHGIGQIDQDKGLFDDDSDDGIFAPPKNNSIQQIKQPYLQSNKPMVPVFDEEPPLFEDETIAKEKKKPTGGVSLFGNSDIFQSKILKQRKASSSEESNEDQPQFTQKDEINSISKVISPADNHSKKIPQNKNFNEPPISSVPRNKEPEKKKSLPFDDDIFGDDLFSSVDKKSSTGLFESSSLFSDEETDKLFSSNKSSIKVETPKITKRSERSKNLQSTAVKSPETPDTEYSFRKSSKSNIHSLFDDSKDDINSFVTKDIDKKQTYPKEDPEENKKEEFDQTKKLKSITGLFDDLDDVDDLFSGMSKRNDEKKDKKSISFLFDDNDEDDYNIFAPKNEKKTHEREKVIKNQTSGAVKNEIKEKTKPEVSLFDDDLPKINIGNSEKEETEKSTKIKESKEKDQENKKADTKLSFSDGDLRDKKEISKKEKPVVEAKESTKVEQSTEDRTNKKISLFDENYLNDSEAKSKKGETISNTQKQTNIMEPKEQESTIKQTKPKIGLFDDDLDDMDDLFSQFSKKKDVEETSKSDNSLFSESSPLDVDKKPKQSGDVKPNITEEKSKELKKPITSKKPNIKVDPVKSKSRTKDFKIENPSPIENKNSENSERPIKNVMAPLEGSKEVKEKKDTLTTIEKGELPSENKHVTVPSISVAEIPKTTVERPSDLGEDSNPPNIETDKYKTSPSALNVKFMDSMPPPDDDWDTYSDNTFDDMDQVNDGYQSQPSSLFDNEPPSLIFNDISFIPKDSESQIKVPSDNSNSLFKRDKEEDIPNDSKGVANDSDIGSRKHNDGFLNESESSSSKFEEETPIQEDHPKSKLEEGKSSVADENIEKIKVLDEAETLDASNTELETEKHFESKNRIKSKPPISKKKPDVNKKTEKSVSFDSPSEDLNEKKDSLFSEILNEDQTDFLFSNTKLQNDDKKDSEITENIISDKTIEKIISFDNSDENQIGPNESGVSTQSDDNMQKNILKITEKLQQISHKTEDRTKPIAVPGKLSHNLNINVGALLPGSALPKREKTQDSHNDGNLSKSLPASRFSLDEVVPGSPQYVPTKPIAILRGSSEESPSTKTFLLEKSVSFDGGTNIEVLQSITKDRARIPVKRRPSSRRARQKSLRDSISDFRLDDPIPDEALANESDKKGSSNEATPEQNIQEKHPSVLSQEQGNLEKEEVNNVKVQETKTNKSSKEADNPDDLFQNIEKDIKNVNKANIISTKKKEVSDDDSDELFKKVNVRKNIDSLFHDDYLFGNIGPLSVGKHNDAKDIKSSVDQNSLLSHKKELITKARTENEPKIIPQTKIVGKTSLIDNLFDSSDDEDIFKSTKVKQFKNVNLKKREEPPTVKVETKAETSTSVKVQSNKSDKLFDFSDDEDFLGNFTKRKNDNKLGEKKSTGKRQSNLFDEMDDDDIFGTSRSSENKTKQDVKPSVILKKPPKSTSLRKLENIDGDEDPLSALLK